MDVVKSIRGMTNGRSVFVKMMDSQKIAGTSVSTTNYPMTNHVGHRDDRRTHGALCTGTYLCHVHTVAYDPWITWISGSRRKTQSKWVFRSSKPPSAHPNRAQMEQKQSGTKFPFVSPPFASIFIFSDYASFGSSRGWFLHLLKFTRRNLRNRVTNFLKKEQGRVWDCGDGSFVFFFII